MQAYKDIGFEGPIRPDHVPQLVGEDHGEPDNAWTSICLWLHARADAGYEVERSITETTNGCRK